MSENKKWFEVSGSEGPFGHDYLAEFGVDEKRTEIELKSIRAILQQYAEKIGHKPRVLDLASGIGRIGQPLAETRDASIVSADLHHHSLAKHKNKDFTNPVQTDMRKLPFADKSFEMIMLMFTSFGYFNDNENFKVLTEMERCLANEGKALIDMPNSERLREHFKTQRIKEVFDDNGNIDHVVTYTNKLEERKSDLQEFFSSNALFLIQERSAKYNDDVEKKLEPIILRVYTRKEMEALIENTNFHIESITDMDLSQFEPNHSRRMWIHLGK